jgi:hypothetical protein
MYTARLHPAVRVAAVLALLSPIAASPLRAQCSPADRTSLEAFDKSWGDATVSGDRARMAPYVADNFNNRVLGFECAGSNCDLATFAAASRVIGQANFGNFYANGGVGGAVTAAALSSPRGVAVDPLGLRSRGLRGRPLRKGGKGHHGGTRGRAGQEAAAVRLGRNIEHADPPHCEPSVWYGVSLGAFPRGQSRCLSGKSGRGRLSM